MSFPCSKPCSVHSKDRLKSLNGLQGPAHSDPWPLPDPTLSFSLHSLCFSHTDIFPVVGVPQVCSCLGAWPLLFPCLSSDPCSACFLTSFRTLIRCHLVRKLSLTRVLILPCSVFLFNPFSHLVFFLALNHHLTFVYFLSRPIKL